MKDAQLLREKTLQAALQTVERLQALIADPASSRAEVLKAAALIFARVDTAPDVEQPMGDFDICIKED